MEVKLLISLGKFDEAIALLEKKLTESGESLDALFIIRGDLSDLENNVTKGLINQQEERQIRAQIRRSLINLANNIKKPKKAASEGEVLGGRC